VVDTNVAVVANGRDTHVDGTCIRKAIELLIRLRENGSVLIDDAGLILAEYGRNLRPAGQPGVGDRFYRHVIDNQGNASRVRTVDVEQPRGDALRAAFAAGTLAGFDVADRPFALCSTIGRAPVATATDSDWADHEVGLIACGVRIEYVCGQAVAAGGRSRRAA
jgi:hypothetical protein